MVNTIEDFYIETNGIGDYYGVMKASLITQVWAREMMIDACYGEVVNDVQYIRMGVKKTNGTLLTKEQFQPYFDQFGQDMITHKDWRELKAKYAEVGPDEI